VLELDLGHPAFPIAGRQLERFGDGSRSPELHTMAACIAHLAFVRKVGCARRPRVLGGSDWANWPTGIGRMGGYEVASASTCNNLVA
jgi:hypothetical protein